MIQTILILALIIVVVYLYIRQEKFKKELDNSIINSNRSINGIDENIAELYRRSRDFVAKIDEQKISFDADIELLHHKINHPFKYKIGDKVDRIWVVTNTNIERSPIIRLEISFGKPTIHQYKNTYTLTNTKTGETKVITD